MIKMDEFKLWLQSRRCYVIADPKDNSITLSKRLFAHIRRNADGDGMAKVFVFFVPDEDRYAFMVNPNIEHETQMCEIQYNAKYKCIGFETLCPTVGRIFYDYGLSADKQKRLPISVRKTVNNETYYQIRKPYEKCLGKCKKT